MELFDKILIELPVWALALAGMFLIWSIVFTVRTILDGNKAKRELNALLDERENDYDGYLGV